MQTETFHIGIVGFGPKGLYSFERLLAYLNHFKVDTQVNIHLFNESSSFGAGWVYHKDQPEYLLMNYPNQFISLQPTSKPSAICEVLSFSEWLSEKQKESIIELDPKVSSRKNVGTYLCFYFEKFCSCLPNNVSVYKHITSVEDIKQKGDDFKLKTSTNIELPLLNAIVITTGHTPSITSKEEFLNVPNNIPFVYPIEKKLNVVNPQSTVILKGIGLTAIDAILGLTEGKNGEFKQESNTTFSYLKSGNEPKIIYPYSRSGIPIIPRGENALNYEQTSFFLKDFIASQNFKPHSLDFETDVLPIIKQDIVGEFYNTLFQLHNVSYGQYEDFNGLKNRIEKFHKEHPEVEHFEAENLLAPTLALNVASFKNVYEFWTFWCLENEKAKSPYVAAASAWRYISKDFNLLYSQQKLTKKSKQLFQTKYFGLFNKISYGPPLVNIKKMLALIEANILDFSFSESPTISENTISNSNQSSTYDWLIDARLPRGFSNSKSVLFNSENSAKLFTTTKVSNTTHELHCTNTGHPINKDGKPLKSIVLYGTPTENILFDNDTLSRTHNDTVSGWAKNIAKHLSVTTQLISS